MKKGWIWIGGIALVAVGGLFYFKKGDDGANDIEFRYSKVEKGELVKSISATGTLVALTTVDVKSKAGGKVVRLVVDEGSIVKKGDLIALIDPADTRATYDQAAADLRSSEARADQAVQNLRLQQANNATGVADARAALAAARIRLQRVELETRRAPALANASIATAQASLNEAIQAKRKLLDVTIPSRRREVEGNYARANAELDAAQADYERQAGLEKEGYVAGSKVDAARSALEAAKASFRLAEQARASIQIEIDAQIRTADAAIARATAGYEQAKANGSDAQIAQRNLAEARNQVATAEIDLRKALDAGLQERVRKGEISAAEASTVRSRVSLANAKVQLESTTVVAPRDGVVTQKYLEEGTIIPPGTSTFSQGPSIVQLSDVTTLYVECAVDEADVASVAKGQNVRITTEAYKTETLDGVVDRVNPSAKTDQNVTSVKVRVRVKLPGKGKIRLLPGMNATCEFITLSKKGVMVLPQQALIQEDGKSYVRVKTGNAKKPEKREVKVGETGNDGVEVISGISVGEEVVTAEINLAEAREIQKKMVEAQQGGGLTGGGNRGMRSFGGTTGGARSGGGASTGGGAPKMGGASK